MKIETVQLYLLEAELKRPFAYSRGWFDKRGAVLVEITTDSGITGWGEAFGPPRMSFGALEILKPMLLGADPLCTELIWQQFYSRFREHGRKGPLVDALSALDIALWDIKGKHFGLPIHRLLGGPLRTHVPVYATGLFLLNEGNPEDYLAKEALSYIDEGYNAIKLKVGFGLDYDIKAVKAVRSAIGSRPQLMIDANEAYDSLEAIRLGRRISEYDITWFEEPVPPEDLTGYRTVKASQPIPVAGGEAEFTRFGFRDIVSTHAMDIIQPDICAAGGFSECMKIADMANAFGVRCNPHVWGTAVAIAASLQWLGVLPDSPMSLNPVSPLLELDRTEHPIRDALVTDALRPKSGKIAIPEKPGLGIEVDRDVLMRFRLN